MTDALRPKSFSDFHGQLRLKERLNIHISSAKVRQERLEHMLLIGPPGCGKTTLSEIVANEMGQEFAAFVMPIDPRLLVQLMRGFEGIVLFDELHRSPPKQQELLLTIVEGDYYQVSSGKRFYNHAMTLVGATTEPEKIIAPLYDRFPIKPSYDEYSVEEMAAIVRQKAHMLGLPCSEEDALIYAKASAGTPRNAQAIVVMARDLALAKPDLPTPDEVLEAMRITHDGLTEDHLRYIAVLNKVGGVAGVKVLSNHLRLPEPFLLELERALIKQGLIEYTARGRELVHSFGPIKSTN